MSDSAVPPGAGEEAMASDAAVAPLPLREVVRWVPVAVLLLVVIHLTVFDQGELSRAGSFLHELMHDGRHLLAIPCH